MSEKDEYQQLAARLMDLWQEQMTLMAQDPEYQAIAHAWSRQFASQALPAAGIFPFFAQGSASHDSTAQPAAGGPQDGPEAASPASVSSDDTLRELARTLEQLNRRLEQLESGLDTSGAEGKGGPAVG